MAEVLRYLPSDARTSRVFLIDGATASCAVVNISSVTLTALFPGQSTRRC